ncbi:MAG: hypothetical protein IKA68_05290 [Clostridia bacterium]|nr:hypothetical protein [Clostridia bacterium]
MLMKKIIAVILTALMLLSTFTILVQAKASSTTATEYTYKTNKNTATMNYMTGEYKNDKGETIIVDTEEEKLATMDLRVESNGYRIYIDEYSGEVAVENVATGELMFSNPINASTMKLEDSTRTKFLSQILIDYIDTSNNNQECSYNSYANAVSVGTKDSPLPSQLVVKPIKDGVRVDYAIGRVDSRYLVPERIAKTDFEEKILNVAIEAGCTQLEQMQLENYFKLYDLNDPKAQTQVIRDDWLKKYPMIEHTPIYAFTGATKREYRAIEKLIKAYCPDYTYEDLDNGHLALDYVPSDKAEALFNIAIEYKIEETYQGSGVYGLTVRVPANGIRFDESVFQLESIQILPYMGANTSADAGYSFFPDGTGTLFASDELSQKKSDTYFYGTVYGDDFAYYNLGSGAPHNEIVRYPVYGVVDEKTNADGTTRDTGFFAIVEEGDAMTKLIAYYNYTAKYNTIRVEVNPRPSDTYSLSDAISVSGLSTWTVVSARKYTGDFKIRYIMLTDEDVAKEKKLTNTYTPDYMGMAEAYRDYLVGNGILTRLTEEDVKEDIPLYIETFGCSVTTKRFLSIPYTTEVPLTSFSDVQKMYAQLSENGVKNVNFILTGYTEGGLKAEKIPYNLNWDNAVEKEIDFEELLEDAKTNGYGIYPDFDFAFCSTNTFFDPLILDKHAIKTIDDRYTSKREYSATRQTFINYFELAMSPAYFDHFYTKLTENYLEYEPIGISVSTLGSYLSSDFDEDEPYNREDSKLFTAEAFKYFDSQYEKVLTSGGNVYTWKYVDHITEAATDSSRHARSSATVPFLGIVLHGYVQFAGSAINMEGNIDYALLRAIENGASIKFILSYRNTEKLKEYYNTSVYYSVRYDIWVNDLIARYKEINEVLKDVQTSIIVEHKFIDADAMRIPDDNELTDDAVAALLAAAAAEQAAAAATHESVRLTLQTIRKNLTVCGEKLPTALDETLEGSVANLYKLALERGEDLDAAMAAISSAKDALDALVAEKEALEAEKEAADNAATEGEGTEGETTETEATEGDTTEGEGTEGEGTEGEGTEDTEPTIDEKIEAVEKAIEEATKAHEDAIAAAKAAYAAYAEASKTASAAADELVALYEFANENIGMLDANEAFTADIRAELKTLNTALVSSCDALKAYADNELAALADAVAQFKADNEELFPEEEETAEPETPEETEPERFNKYAVVENSVVYEEYENGKKLVLNFNNYAIKVKIDGAYYTVDAYGYIIIA